VAVDHNPDITLTRHRFSRSGDLWKHALPGLRRKPIAFEIFGLLNVERVWQRGSYRVPIPCPYCQALKLTADGTYAIRFSGGGVNDCSGVNDRPQQVGCLACGRGLDVTDLLEDWKARDLDRLLKKGPLVAYCPRPQTFIVDQPEPGKFWIGLTVYDALRGNVGPVFPLTRRLSRIEAMNPGHAMTLVGQHHASMTWRDVTITGELEPEDPAWHGGPLAHWEQDRVHRCQLAERRQKREALDAEMEKLRATRASELGI
jgi:hypothetical protein